MLIGIVCCEDLSTYKVVIDNNYFVNVGYVGNAATTENTELRAEHRAEHLHLGFLD